MCSEGNGGKTATLMMATHNKGSNGQIAGTRGNGNVGQEVGTHGGDNEVELPCT